LLFEFYPDEPSFTEGEFVGLTASEAMDLGQRNVVGYVRS
jgi:hypothetical protein